MVFPTDLDRDIKRGRQAKIQLIFDASDPMTAASALNAGNAIGLYYSVELATAARRGGAPVEPPLEVRSRAWYNPSMVTANFMVPGIIGALLMMVTMMLTAMAIVRERERGTLEQLLVSPVKRTELIIGKLIPYIGLAYIVISITLVLGRYLFGVPVAGSLALLYGLTFIFFMTTLGLGMFISTVAKTQQQAMQMSFFFFLPSMMLSGFMFPIAAMPGWVQPVSWFIPLTYYLEIVRGIILKGVGLEYLWRQALALVVFGVVILSLSVTRMGKRLW
jgi:ABC-2 type transport system permease protein